VNVGNCVDVAFCEIGQVLLLVRCRGSAGTEQQYASQNDDKPDMMSENYHTAIPRRYCTGVAAGGEYFFTPLAEISASYWNFLHKYSASY
jgi:hypothetical protein